MQTLGNIHLDLEIEDHGDKRIAYILHLDMSYIYIHVISYMAYICIYILYQSIACIYAHLYYYHVYLQIHRNPAFSTETV